MNASDAKRIAETVTRDQLEAMFENAKSAITDWSARSKVNPTLSLGAVWNIMYPLFVKGGPLKPMVKKNMVWAFGDYLEESAKPAKAKRKPLPAVHHQEPVFEVPA